MFPFAFLSKGWVRKPVGVDVLVANTWEPADSCGKQIPGKHSMFDIGSLGKWVEK